MKKLYLILIILISFEFSNQFTTLPNKFVPAIKCFFGTAENIKALISFVNAAFSSSNMFPWLQAITQLQSLVQNCLGIDIMKFLPILQSVNVVQNQKEAILYKLQNAKAPLILRKYLYDYAMKGDIFKAKMECVEMTQMTPYEQYKQICDLFE